MQSKEPKKISRDDYMKALALFVCANDLYVRLRQFEFQLAKFVGDGTDAYYCGHVSDALYADQPATTHDFDEALRKENLVVEG